VVREVPEPDASGTTADPVTVNMTSGLASTVNFGLHFNGPALSASGPATATIGQPYTIQLGATDPLHTISEWMINWGDNTIQDFPGNPTQASHTYLIGGKTYTIVASATDDTGTYTAAPLPRHSYSDDRWKLPAHYQWDISHREAGVLVGMARK
jgi:hypothetical protein